MHSSTHKSFELLPNSDLLAAGAAHASLDASFEVLAEVDSTQTRLLSQVSRSTAALQVCVAHHQIHGRGRLDRSWESAPGDGLMFSVGFRPASLQAVPMLVGVAVARAVAHYVPLVELKWPNDLVVASGNGLQKLGGIVVSVHPDDSTLVVAGIGINFGFSGPRPTAQAGALSDYVEAVPSREELLIRVLEQLVAASAVSEAVLLDDYRSLCHTLGTVVRVTPLVGEAFEGRATGVELEGLTVTKDDGETRVFMSGDVEHLRNS